MRNETTLHIAPDHPAFEGHFPGAPIVPGVVLLDAAVHAALEMFRATGNGNGVAEPDSAGLCSVASVKFLRPVGPGEVLTVFVDSTAGGARFEFSCRGAKVAAGTLVVPPRRE
jgi:3-hydroxyacyl-[acyl-carrier-protein] dehydratase